MLIILSCNKDKIEKEQTNEDIKVSINIDNDEKDVSISKELIIDFSDKVVKLDGSEIDDKNMREVLSFKQGDSNGKEVAFNLNIDNDKKKITIKPNVLNKSTKYYFRVHGKKLKGKNGEKVIGKEIFFTTRTDDTKDISVSINIKNDEKNVSILRELIIDFSDKVVKLDGSQIDDKNMGEVFSFKQGDSKGKEVAFSLNIGDDKKQIKIKLNVLNKSTKYYFKVDGSKLKGENGEKILSKEIVFTTEAGFIGPLNITDPLYKDQWYLKNTGQFGGTPGVDINIEPVWKQGYTGKGMHIAILDEPLPITESKAHEDLKSNQNFAKSYNYFPFKYEFHGLNTAGIIAASGNNVGLRGIAYQAKIYTYGILGGKDADVKKFVNAMQRVIQIPEICVINNSWGIESIDLEESHRLVLEKGLQTGFNGRGLVYVNSAGNKGLWRNSTIKGMANYYGLILINSLNNNGVNTNYKSLDFKTIAYLTAVGSNIWVSAPGSRMITTGSNTDTKKGYTEFYATSSAAPVVSGIVALMRQAEPNLTWRDVKLILAESTIKNDDGHKGWKIGYAKKRNGGNFYFNHRYGFGMVNAKKAIALSKIWTNLPSMKTKTFSSANLNLAIDANVKENKITVQNSGISFIESVVVELELEKKLNVKLTEKFDMKLEHRSIVSHLHMENKGFYAKGYGDKDKYLNKSSITFKMLTNAHLGGNANGEWKIKIKDTDLFTKLKKWKLIIRGH